MAKLKKLVEQIQANKEALIKAVNDNYYGVLPETATIDDIADALTNAVPNVIPSAGNPKVPILPSIHYYWTMVNASTTASLELGSDVAKVSSKPIHVTITDYSTADSRKYANPTIRMKAADSDEFNLVVHGCSRSPSITLTNVSRANLTMEVPATLITFSVTNCDELDLGTNFADTTSLVINQSHNITNAKRLTLKNFDKVKALGGNTYLRNINFDSGLTIDATNTSGLSFAYSNIPGAVNIINSDNVRTDNWLFRNAVCTSIGDINLPSVTSAQYTFNNTTADSLGNVSMAAATRHSSCFQGCRCKTVGNVSMPSLTSASSLFGSSYIESIGDIDLSAATNAESLFGSSSNLKTIGTITAPNVTSYASAFYRNSKLTSVTFADTSKVTNMNQMFYSCTLLRKVPYLDCTSCINIASVIGYVDNMYDVGSFYNLGAAYSTTASANYSNYCINWVRMHYLQKDSLIVLANNLHDIATKGCNAQQIKLYSGVVAKLTSDEIALFTNKGWTIVVG